MSGAWHDSRGYPPRPFPYRESCRNKNIGNTGPHSPSHAELASVPSNASSVYVVDGTETMKQGKQPSSIKNTGKYNDAEKTTSDWTLIDMLLVAIFWLLLATLIGSIVYFFVTTMDTSESESPETPDLDLLEFYATFQLDNLVYNNALSDNSTDEFQQLATKVTDMIDGIYTESFESSHYVGSKVISFRQGSVIVDCIIKFLESLSTVGDNTISSDSVLETFVNNVIEANETSLLSGIDPASIVINEGTDSNQINITNTEINGTRTPPLQGCGIQHVQLHGSQRIIGGQMARPGEWPWLVSIQYGNDQNRQPHCGGAIIGQYWILTAAHCTYNESLNQLSVFVNSTTIGGENGYFVDIEEIYMHPSYDDLEIDYDVALLRLRTRIEFSDIVSPICMEPMMPEDLRLDDCYVAGWGVTVPDTEIVSDKLLDARVPVIEKSLCYGYFDYDFTDRMICAGYEEGGIDSCTGDSGGPLMCPSENGVWYVIGVTSWGYGCATPLFPGVYADLSSMTSFIFYILDYWPNVTYTPPE